MKDAKFSNLTLKDENGNTVYTSQGSQHGYGGVFDITLGNIQVRDGFFFGVNNENTGQGWRIGGNLVLDLDYELIKTVAAGTSATDVTFSGICYMVMTASAGHARISKAQPWVPLYALPPVRGQGQ